MAGALLHPPKAVSLEEVVQVALERGYTAQGEMFSASDVAKLAEEVFPCQAELLSGGLEGQNRERILQHLLAGLPLLIPYDEDSNHEPCLRRGYKAHWAVVSEIVICIAVPQARDWLQHFQTLSKPAAERAARTDCVPRSSAWPEGGLPTAGLPGGRGDARALPRHPSVRPAPPGGRDGDVPALQAGQELPLPAVGLPAGAGEQRPADRLQPQAGGRWQGLRRARRGGAGGAVRPGCAAASSPCLGAFGGLRLSPPGEREVWGQPPEPERPMDHVPQGAGAAQELHVSGGGCDPPSPPCCIFTKTL
ncbi:PREDICTED: UPF0692 protein C19orf54 homolog isoform X1 [Gekko japonicus]|uniref:Actin maturation protease n=1 Tax=Gekko japonicus TaxID=146911 RepID=A0ABM1JXB5_GEKJA|nr:PREDICTED: UPF0692 protein C19orf54 homolog isoform X1 [Gekko japonicus]